MLRNMVLLEAVSDQEESKVDIPEIVKEIKRVMNTCKLTKFKSDSSCGQFYSLFFLSTLGDINPTVDQWSSIYTELLSQNTFCEDLAKYMSIYRPSNFTGIFAPLWNKIQLELYELKKNKVHYLSMTKAYLTTLQTRMDGVGQIVRNQVNDPEILKFVNVVNMTLGQFVMDLNKLIQETIIKEANPESIIIDSRTRNKLSEDAIELIGILENANEIFSEMCGFDIIAETTVPYYDENMEPVDEGIVRNVALKAKEAAVAIKKAQRDFDQLVMRKVRKIREERRNRKHAQMVGEALAINHEVKRLLKSAGWFIIHPALGVIRWVIGVVYDRATDKKDRAILIRQIKDEVEIIEEKIQMAERNGDDKARIELIRARQKMVKEYERITNIRFSAERRNQIANMSN